MGRRYRTKSNTTAGEALAVTCGFIVFFPAWLVFGLLLFPVFSIFSFVISFVPMIFLFKFAAESGAGKRRLKNKNKSIFTYEGGFAPKFEETPADERVRLSEEKVQSKKNSRFLT